MSILTDRRHISLSDEKIIEMYWNREENAIMETNQKYGQFLFRIAYGILHDRMDCEECQNDTYLGIWKAIPPAKPDNFPAFIAQIMRRTAINKYKEKACKKRIPSELTSSIEDYEETLVSNDTLDRNLSAEEIGRIINDYVKDLPERQRYIFVARFYFAESVESISDTLNTSLATVYRNLVIIKQGLKHHLEKNEVHL